MAEDPVMWAHGSRLGQVVDCGKGDCHDKRTWQANPLGFCPCGAKITCSWIDYQHMVMHGPAMARNKISTTVYITAEQNEQLKLLHQKTKVPVAEYIRQGIDLILEREKAHLPGQLTLDVIRK
jgi:hypothetical protein